MNHRHVSLIARYSARHSVRGGVGLIFLLLSLSFGLLAAHMILQPVELGVQQLRRHTPADADPATVQRDVHDNLLDAARPVVAWILGAELDTLGRGRRSRPAAPEPDAPVTAASWADFLLLDRPGILSAILVILILGWPLIVACGAFDLYSSDIGSRQLRYQLLRADRTSIYFGRLLGSLLTLVVVLVALGATIAVYIGMKLPVYGWSDLLTWSAYGTGALVLLSLPYLALCAWISASSTSAFASLTIATLVIGGLPLFALLGKQAHDAVGYINYLLPWGYQLQLLHPSALHVGLAAVGCIATTAVFVWLGHRKFTTRDL